MTKREMFTAMLAIPEIAYNAEMTEFINHEIELLIKKSSAERKPTKVQRENEAFKAAILNYLVEMGTAHCIKELQAEIPEISELSNQRVTHLMTALVNSGKVTKEYVKKTPFYSAVLDDSDSAVLDDDSN